MCSPTRRHELELRGGGIILRAATLHTLDVTVGDRFELGRTLQANIPPGWPPPDLDSETIAALRSRLAETPGDAGWCGWFLLQPGSGLGIPTLLGFAGLGGRPDSSERVEIRLALVGGLEGCDLAGEATELLATWAAEDTKP